jgi:hypothetical protein
MVRVCVCAARRRGVERMLAACAALAPLHVLLLQALFPVCACEGG